MSDATSVIKQAIRDAGAEGPIAPSVQSTGVDLSRVIQKACQEALQQTESKGRIADGQADHSKRGIRGANDLRFESACVVKKRPQGDYRAETIAMSPLGYTCIAYGPTAALAVRRMKFAYREQLERRKACASFAELLDVVADSRFYAAIEV